MPQDHLKPVPLSDALLATALTWNGGFVDALGFIAFYEIFPGTMSGNAIAVGIGFAREDLFLIPILVFAIVLFLAGLTAGSAAIRLGRRSGLKRLLAIAMALEIACLGALLVLDPSLPSEAEDASVSGTVYASLGLIAFGMGVQNTSLRAAGIMNMYTTHITGTISQIGDDLVTYFASRHRWRREGGPRPKADPLILGTVMCLAYGIGAFLGALALDEMGWTALVVPVVLAMALAALDLAAPFAGRSRAW